MVRSKADAIRFQTTVMKDMDNDGCYRSVIKAALNRTSVKRSKVIY